VEISDFYALVSKLAGRAANDEPEQDQDQDQDQDDDHHHHRPTMTCVN
jgi:hypothetical protein